VSFTNLNKINKSLKYVLILSKEQQSVTEIKHNRKRGMVLPFEQHFITFDELTYSIEQHFKTFV